MSLYDKMSIGFGPGFGVGTSKLFNLKPTDGTGDLTVVRADTDASELVTNGSFASDTAWTKGSGWTISGGLATSTGAVGGIEQTLVITAGVEYYVEVTTSGGAYNYGGLKVRLGGDTNLAQITEDGTYTFKLTAEASTDFGFFVDVSNAFSGSIDDVSVKSAEFLYAATRINAEGFIDGVRPNVPRSSFPLGGSNNGCPSLFTEPNRENKCLQSQTLDNVYWTASRLSVTADQTTAPDGTTTGDQLTDTTDNATHRLYSGVISKTIADEVFCVSVFFKKGNSSDISGLIKFANGNESDATYLSINLDTGAVMNATDGTNYTILDSGTDDYGDGWFRLYAFVQSPTSTSSPDNSTRLHVSIGGPTGSLIFAGTGTDYLYAWGAQVEKNVAYTTSYIPTTSAAKTREADEVNNAGDSDDFNDDEGVLYANMASINNDLTAKEISVSDGTNDEVVSIGYNTTTQQLRAYVKTGGVLQCDFTETIADITVLTKVALKYKVNDFALFINGIEVDTDTSGSIPSGLSELNLDNGAGSNNFYGKCKELVYFNEALTDTELTELTS
jgi:hypothetical protein